MRKLVVTLVVLAALALAVDRGADLVAERAAGSAVQESQGLTQRPEVTIGGFPFLTQLVAGSYDRVEVTAHDVPVDGGGGSLTLGRLDAVLTGVSATRDYSRIDVDRVRADALIGYDDLGDLLGIELGYGGSGSIEAKRTFTILGQDVTPTVTVQPRVVDGALAFGEPALNGFNDATGAVADALDAAFGTPVPLQGIPFDIDLDDVRVRRDGVHLLLSGADLTYTVES